MSDLPKRKPNRILSFDYSEARPYFITVCTAEKRCILGHIAGMSGACQPFVALSEYGKTVEQSILAIPVHYKNVEVNKFVVMPNHIHLILWFRETEGKAPTVSQIIQQMKGIVTKKLGVAIWQKGFHDHVIRGEEDYLEIWQYIENNPLKWALDRYYTE